MAAGTGIGLVLATGVLVGAIFVVEAMRVSYPDEPAAQLAGIALIMGAAAGGAAGLSYRRR